VCDLAGMQWIWRRDTPVAAVVFYRALLQADDLAPVEAMIAALNARGIDAASAELAPGRACADLERRATPTIIEGWGRTSGRQHGPR